MPSGESVQLPSSKGRDKIEKSNTKQAKKKEQECKQGEVEPETGRERELKRGRDSLLISLETPPAPSALTQ